MGPNIARQNGVYKTIKTRVPPTSIVQPNAFLRLEQNAQNAKSRYNFPIQKNVGTSANTERKLDQNDAFIVTHLAFSLINEEPTTSGLAVLQTYPNPLVFPAESGNVTPAHLESFYNGSVYIKVGDKVYSDGILLSECRKVPITQQMAAVASVSPAFANSEKQPFDQFIEISPIVTLDGAQKTEINIDVPAWAGQQVQYATATSRVKLVLVLFGFLATGASGVGQIDITTP